MTKVLYLVKRWCCGLVRLSSVKQPTSAAVSCCTVLTQRFEQMTSSWVRKHLTTVRVVCVSQTAGLKSGHGSGCDCSCSPAASEAISLMNLHNLTSAARKHTGHFSKTSTRSHWSGLITISLNGVSDDPWKGGARTWRKGWKVAGLVSHGFSSSPVFVHFRQYHQTNFRAS